ncbi:MAG: 30S ribosomal protein S6 [Patescibacteria group bacterium]|nr:30S ribosomal protein S6 [Patescibacteria group bacterium]
MNNYELLYILPASITGEEIKTAFLEIEKSILKLGGKKLETLLAHPFLIKAETSKEENAEGLKDLPIIKRRLAYPIKKNRVGFYCLFNFSSEPNKLKEIDDYLRMNNFVIRHLIIQSDPMTKDEIRLLEKLFARKRAEQEKQEKSKEKEKKKEVKKETVVLKKQEPKPADKKEVAKTKEERKLEEQKDVQEKKKKEEKEETEKKKVETKEKKDLKEKKEATTKKKKIKLEDLEDKLDEILKDTSMI